jgi:ABC-type transport system involved in multi-copper enzyme maturation permease subunit
MKLLTIISNTLTESMKRITLLIYIGIGTVILILVLTGLHVERADGSITSISIFGAELPNSDEFPDPSAMVYTLTIGGSLMGIMLFGMFATAGIIPAFLKRGTIDIYLSKPVSRFQLLLAKYLGAVVTVSAAMLYFYLGLFGIVGLKTGIWNTSVLHAWLLSIVLFGTVYAMAAFLGVLSRNIAIVLIFVYLHIFILSGIIHSYEEFPMPFMQSAPARTIFLILDHALPRVQSMQQQIMFLFERQLVPPHLLNTEFTFMPFIYSTGSGLLFFFAAYVLFRRRDY